MRPTTTPAASDLILAAALTVLCFRGAPIATGWLGRPAPFYFGGDFTFADGVGLLTASELTTGVVVAGVVRTDAVFTLTPLTN
jgi:hypothetical protein